jgi:hypothetical protein
MDAPYYLVVTAPTPGNIDNLIFTYAQGPNDITVNQVAIASYDGQEWKLQPLLDNAGILDEIFQQNITTGRVGPYYGLKTEMVSYGYGADYINGPGGLIDKMGQRQIFVEDFTTPVIAADPEWDWRRVDRILYRRPSDSALRIGERKFMLGGSYADVPSVLYSTNLFSGAIARHTPKVITDSENLAHIFSTSGSPGNYSLTYARLSSDRQTVLEAETVLTTGLDNTEFDIVIDKIDAIHILYEAGGDIIYQQMDTSGAFIGSSMTLTSAITGVSTNPHGKVDANGVLFHIVFSAIDGLVEQIYYVSVDLTAAAIATPARVLVAGTNNLINPDIFVSSDFILHVAWEDSTTGSIYYQTYSTLLVPRGTIVHISAGTEYSEGGILINAASSPKIIVTDNQVPFVAFAQAHATAQYGISIWSPEGAYQKMLFNSSEAFSHYDLFIEDIFNNPALIVARSNSVDYVKLSNNEVVDFTVNLSVNACNGVALVKDRLGSVVVVWSDDTNGLYAGKVPAESYTMAFSYSELESDLLLSRIVMPEGLIINWVLGDKPGSFYDFLIAYGQSVVIDWGLTASSTLTMGSGLHVLDLYTDTNYTVAAGSYGMAEGEALFLTLDGVTLSVIPQVAPLALVPWDSNAVVLGINKDGEFNPVLLGMAGMTQLDSGESIIFGEDLPQSIRTRLGIISEIAFQAYTSTLAINVSDTYPQALSNLDIMSAQNRHARLVKFEGDWEVVTPNTLRITSDCYVQIPGLTEARNTIAAQSILLASDGDIAYITLNRTSGAASTRAVTVAQADTVIPTRNTFVVARRTPTGVEVDNQAVTYTDRLSTGQINNIVVDGDPLEKAIKRLDVREDVVKRVRVITRTLSVLPTGVSCTIDTQTLADGDKVLFAHSLLNGIYQIAGVGASISWTKLYEFAGSQVPTAKSCVLVTEGGEINRTLWSYDSVKGWYRLSTLEDFVEVRAADFITTTLPSGAGPLVVDGQTIIEGELVLYGNAALNRVYRVTGIGLALEFEAVNVFNGLMAPNDGSLVLAEDGSVSDIMWEYDTETAAWVYLTLTTQNKAYLGLTSPDKAGGTFEDQLSPNQLNNVVAEGDSLETALKRLDIRPDVLKRVAVIDLTTATLPSSASVVIDGVTLSNDDKVLYGNPALAEGTGIFQVAGIGTGATWTKLYEFGGSQSPTPAAAVLVTKGSHTNRTVWLYNSVILPPWERIAGTSENVWTGADAVTAPTFDGTLSPADTTLAKALLTVDKYFRALQIREHPTNKMRVVLTESEVTKTDLTTTDSLINGKLMRFVGAQIDFSAGAIYEADGVTLISLFSAPAVPDNEYFWYGIALELDTAQINNMIEPIIRVNLASTSNGVRDAAPRPSFDEDYVMGTVWVKGTGALIPIEDIHQENVVQIGEINLAALISRIEALEATVSLHTTEINELQSACGAILANTPKRQVFDTPFGGATIYTLNPLVFSVEYDNARMDIDVFIDGRWQPQSILGDFSDGAYRKNSTTELEFAETVLDEQEVIVVKRDAGGIFANAVKIQRFIAAFGGQSVFTLDPLVFTVINDNTVLDVDFYINGRWQKQTITGDFADGAVRKNSLLEVETAETVAAGQEFTVVRRTPNGMSSGGGPSSDLENITVDLGFVIPKSVGTLTKPASSLILKDTANSDIWQLKVTSGALLCVKIS